RGQWRLAIAVSIADQFQRILNGLNDDDAARNQHWQLQSVLNSTITTRLASNAVDPTRAITVSASAQFHSDDADRIQHWQHQ
ncbi:hypothetical protein CKO09_12725, partial [Chromatium weissei]|nr:hypothetical protein [Chromatium weissei]